MSASADTAPAAATPVIQVQELVSYYGAQRILDGVSLRVEPGEIMVIMGGSGSGKSTLLRHLLGLEKPAGGRVQVLGVDVVHADPDALLQMRRRIGVAFQAGALLSSMTVAENITLPLREHTDLDESTMQIVSRMKLEVVDLAGSDSLMPAELSGGMVKRAALARAIVMDPRILFCDEPSAGLDPVVSASIDGLILRLRDALGMTIVVVTHELESAFAIADRIAVLDGGRVLCLGTPDEVRHSTSERVQALLTRRPKPAQTDTDEYLARLTRAEGDRQ